MAALSNFHFSDPCAQSRRAPLTSITRVTPHRTTDLAGVAACVGKIAKDAALLLWAALAMGFSLLVLVDFLL
jgi:hypothetical protein